jgi:hypothetical protein
MKAFINLSQMTVNEMDIFKTTASPQQKQHWLAEQILSWSGLPVVEVQPTAFMEGLFFQTAKAVAMQDKILAPFGKGKNSAIAAVDVARVIAEIISDPAEHIGKAYHLTGPVSGQLAAFGMPSNVVAHVATMGQLHQDNRYDRFSSDVERLAGIPPMSVREFVQRNARAFAPVVPSSASE